LHLLLLSYLLHPLVLSRQLDQERLNQHLLDLSVQLLPLVLLVLWDLQRLRQHQ
jgi:hypothetical protein